MHSFKFILDYPGFGVGHCFDFIIVPFNIKNLILRVYGRNLTVFFFNNIKMVL